METDREMMAVVERIYGTRIRMLEWKDEYFSKSKGSVLFMLRAYTGTQVTEFPVKEVRCLHIQSRDLLSRDSLQSWLDSSIQYTQVFKEDSNARALSEAIFTYLVSNFQFTSMPYSFPSRKPKIVIVADVFVNRFFDNTDQENTIKFDDEEEEEEDECNSSSSCEYGNIEVEKQEMEYSSSTTLLSLEENHDQEEAEDMDDDSIMDLKVEEEDEVVDYDEGYYSELLRKDHLDILNTLRSYQNMEPIGTLEADALKEIEAAVKINRLIDGHYISPADKCPICLQGYLTGAFVATTPCSHVFHTDCIFEWLQKNNSCPLCRSLCATAVHI